MAQRDYTKEKPSIITHDSFADLDLNFTAHPVTGDIVTKKDSEAINR